VTRALASITGNLLKLGVLAALALMAFEVSAGEVLVALRFDDFGGEAVTECEQKLIQACERYGIPITIGVVPFTSQGDVADPAATGEIALGARKVNILVNLVRNGKVEIAQHGYSHRTRNAQYLSEFDGLAVGEQVERIAKGKKYLEDAFKVPITTFIPPWNRYDSNTLVALQVVGFKSLSGGTRSSVFPSFGLRVVPSTCDLRELKSVVQSAQSRPKKDSIVVAVFHAYDFVEVDAVRGKLMYSDLEDIFAWLAQVPEVKRYTISEMTITANDLTMQRFESHKRNWLVCRLLPPFLVTPENRLYGEEVTIKKIYRLNLIRTAVWYLFVGAVVVAVCRIAGGLCLGRRPFHGVISKRTFTFLCTGFLMLVVGYGCRHLSGSYRELTIMVVGLGGLLAVWTLPASVFEGVCNAGRGNHSP
jgi:peptidoglycan/xylan/chitin deacetylase (PgdA/CDA1 family)